MSASDFAEFLPADFVRPLRVFLCYATEDRDAVVSLYKRLRAEGFEPWMDVEDLLPGQHWRSVITREVQQSDAVIVNLSPTAVMKTGYFQVEMKIALEEAKRRPAGTIFLMPVKLGGCELTEELKELQAIDLISDHSYVRLLRALRMLAEPLKDRLLIAAWGNPVVGIYDFTQPLLREMHRCAVTLAGFLVDLAEHPRHVSANRELIDRINPLVSSKVRRYDEDDGLYIDVTCLDEDRSYFIHSAWPHAVCHSHEKLWSGSGLGSEFHAWFWTSISEMKHGVLTWMDRFAPVDNKRLWRKTAVYFNQLVFPDGVRWTVAIEGHEIAQSRRK